MILIADSGSTTTNWCIAHEGKILKQVTTPGANPYFQTPAELRKVIEDVLLPAIKHYPYTQLYFYGAGCAHIEENQIAARSFEEYLHVLVEVESDLLAAARSLCQRQPGIACILGTGSNSGLYNGQSITHQTPALGYILGDEGSGAHLGKQLLADCLKNQLPPEISRQLFATYSITRQELLNCVYRRPFPNQYLASFAPFLAENIHLEPIRQLVYNSFCAFFRRNVLQYPDATKQPIHFVGSIAHHFEETLRQAARHIGLQIGNICQSPLEGLVHYHNQYSN